MVRAVLFDNDGTLVDTSREYRHEIIGRALESLGKQVTSEEMDRFWYEGGRTETVRNVFGVDPEKFWPVFMNIDSWDSRRPYTFAYDDVGFLDDLKEQGIKTGIVTAAPPHIANPEIDLVGRERVEVAVAAHKRNGVRHKPDPHGLEVAMQELGVQPSDTVYVGNSIDDMQTAENAGVRGVMIRRDYDNGYTGPAPVICSLFELRGVLKL
ncbi:MAG: HAD family hydrolase [Nanoarchaeota archaeon]|nr:HAD family hydrolase [Nanoarchaeota archaeon]